ncbi:MAG TPA: maleylpyruvate isomerase family mycothiol-dependent enzyme [Acidimicrobiales bacterium]|nr:maleylpyruvate isomerase family mycothiol-dependent enzyme [Acidimicrobiales bacterium]
MSNSLHALGTSVTDLAELVASLETDDLTRGAYPSEWSVADTLSHLGSGAAIMTELLGATLAGASPPDDFMAATWDAWNAKSPRAQADDVIDVDRRLLEALEAVDDAAAAAMRLPLGEDGTDFSTFVQHRLDEHVLHTWDVRVAFDPTATLLDEVVPEVLDGVAVTAEMSGKPIPAERTVVVHTFDPPRTLRLELGPDAVIIESASRLDRDLDELHLPAEAFVRLVYGRMDAEHTPHGVGGSVDLDELRGVFPGY